MMNFQEKDFMEILTKFMAGKIAQKILNDVLRNVRLNQQHRNWLQQENFLTLAGLAHARLMLT